MRNLLYIILLLSVYDPVFSQGTLSLDEVYQMVLSKSSGAASAQYRKEAAEMNYNFFRSQLKPQIGIAAQLPNYLQTSVPVTQPNGSISFQSVSQASSNGGLTITQVVPQTGATIFATSQLNRFDNFSDEMIQYNGIPVRIGIMQPIFGFNPWKYTRRIEPLNLEEAKRQFDVDIEASRSTATSLYFDILIADQNLKIATANQKINKQLFEIAKERLNLGKVSKDETLQLEIQLKQSDLSLAQALVAKAQAINTLYNTFIGVEAPQNIDVLTPPLIDSEIDIENLKRLAISHRPEVVAYQRSLVEAESNIAEAKANFGLNANLTASFGLARGAETLRPIYNDPFIEQQVNVGINLPIVDWGRRRSAVSAANIQKENIKITFEQTLNDIDNTIVSRSLRYQSLRQEARLQLEIVKVAEERANIAKDRYVLGDIDITNLTIAQQDKDQALRDYINLLQALWVNYQELRVLTGYDIIKQTKITY